MFNLLDKTKQTLPVKVNNKEENLDSIISDPALLEQDQQQLQDLVRTAAEDGEITKAEYEELCKLTVKLGVSNYDLNEMIRMEYKKNLIAKVKLFVEDDGEIDGKEMKALLYRSQKAGVGKEELNSYINEALANYNIERKKNLREKLHKIGISVAVAAVGVAAAYVGLKVQDNKTKFAAAQQGNLKVNLDTIRRINENVKNTTITHASQGKSMFDASLEY